MTALELERLEADKDPLVRKQLAYEVGDWPHPESALALGVVHGLNPDDPYLNAAVLSSLNKQNILEFAIIALPEAGGDVPLKLLPGVFASAAGIDNGSLLPRI